MASKSYDMKVRIHTETLESNLKRILGDMMEQGVSDKVKRHAAELYRDKLRPLVPYKSGELRNTTDIVKYKGDYAIQYNAEHVHLNGKVSQYAEAQYYGDPSWNRTTDNTFDHWNRHLSAFEREDYYRQIAEEIKENMSNGKRR